MSSTQTVIQRFREARLQQRVVARYAAKTLDFGAAEAEAKKAEKRYAENARTFANMKKPGLDSVKYGKALDVLLKNGNAAASAAKQMISTYRSVTSINAKNALKWLNECVRQWGQYSGFGTNSGTREEMQANIYAGAQQLDASLKVIDRTLKGEEVVLDDSWRTH
jgi:Tfp pilus assembly protein PilX